MENRREYSGLIVLTVLGALLLGTRAQQQQQITTFVGNDVTLVPQYTGECKEIIWRINKILVVEMELNPLEEITFDLPRDRFTINENIGALTVRNLTINDSGNYTAEVVMKNDAAHKTEIKLIVIDGYAQQQQITTFVGSDVTLVPQYTGECKEIIWRINKTIMVEMKLNPLEEITFKLPRNRFSINENIGALTIRNLTINDSGNYTAEAVMKNDDVHITEIKLIVHKRNIYKQIIAGVVIPSAIIIIIIAVAVLCVVYKRSQKKKEIKQRTAAMSTTAFLDEDTYEVNTGTSATPSAGLLNEDKNGVNMAEKI